MKKELEDADKGIDLFRVSAWGDDTENVKLADENPRLKNELETATTHVDKLTAKNARLVKELTDLKNTTDQTWSDEYVAGLREDFRLFRNENSRLKKDLKTATENVEKLTADDARLEEQLADLKSTNDQSRPEEKDAKIHERILENLHLKEELSIACENLGGALSSLRPHSIIKRTDPTVSINEGLANTYASGTNEIVTEASKTYRIIASVAIPKDDNWMADSESEAEIKIEGQADSDSDSWSVGEPTPTSGFDNSPKESDGEAM